MLGSRWKPLLKGEHKFGTNEFEDEKEIEKDKSNEENKEKECEIRRIKDNFISMLSKLSISALAMKYTKEIENKVNSLMILFFSLEDGDKVKAYENS